MHFKMKMKNQFIRNCLVDFSIFHSIDWIQIHPYFNHSLFILRSILGTYGIVSNTIFTRFHSVFLCFTIEKNTQCTVLYSNESFSPFLRIHSMIMMVMKKFLLSCWRLYLTFNSFDSFVIWFVMENVRCFRVEKV